MKYDEDWKIGMRAWIWVKDKDRNEKTYIGKLIDKKYMGPHYHKEVMLVFEDPNGTQKIYDPTYKSDSYAIKSPN
jgi:hypothetical protein